METIPPSSLPLEIGNYKFVVLRCGGCSESLCCSRWAGFAIQPNRVTGYAILINNVQ